MTVDAGCAKCGDESIAIYCEDGNWYCQDCWYKKGVRLAYKYPHLMVKDEE